MGFGSGSGGSSRWDVGGGILYLRACVRVCVFLCIREWTR